MEAMDERHLELYDQLKPTLGEAPARNLVRMLPADPSKLATKEHVDTRFVAMHEYIDIRFREVDARFVAMHEYIDMRFREVDARFGELRAEMRAGFAGLESTLTKRMITVLGSWTILVGSAYAWGLAFLRP